jgi:Holliday junction resolvasome RuvABC DNA-binding subunit
MGFFRNNTKRMVQEFKNKSEYYSNDLSKEIKESFEDLKSEFDAHHTVIPEFLEFATEIKSKLSDFEAKKLEEFSDHIRRINHCAKNGVEALRELSFNQRKLTKETLRLYEDFE